MLSYITEPIRRLFYPRNVDTCKRKRNLSSMTPLDFEDQEPAVKKLRFNQVDCPVTVAQYFSGNRFQDWFVKIGQMAAKPIMSLNFSYVPKAGDYVKEDEDSKEEQEEEEEEEEEDDDDEPEIIPNSSVLNGKYKKNHLSKSSGREASVSASSWRSSVNGTRKKTWDDNLPDTADNSSDITVLPSASCNGTSVNRHRKSHQELQDSDVLSDDSSPEETRPSILKKYFSRKKHHAHSSTPLEPFRLGEKEQYRMLLEQCNVGTQAEQDLGRPRFQNSYSSFQSQRTSLKRDGVDLTRLSRGSQKGLVDRLSLHSDLKNRTSKENGVKSRVSLADSKFQSFTSSVAPPKSIFGKLHTELLEKQAALKSSPKERLRTSHLDKWEPLLPTPTPPPPSSGASGKRQDQEITKELHIQRRKSMPVFQKTMFSQEWLNDLQMSLDDCCESRAQKEKKLEKLTREMREKREAKIFADNRKSLYKLAKNLKLKSADVGEEEEDKSQLPEFTPEMKLKIEDALRPTPPEEVLCEGFRLSIARRDMETLSGLNWLNDEIINFYMNMLMERGKNDNFPSVYAFNTFFYPKLISGGHAALRRWTRQVDIFSYNYVLIPVHLGMHWCLAVIDFKQKKIQYYDSMGGQNNECVNALKSYLQDEHRDKKKEEFDMNEWKFETVKNIPQQMNGSDCGMFTLKYAEYITRNAKITFSQRHMPYFRRRMVYEIVTKTLL